VNQPYMCEDLRAGFNEAKMGMNWAGDSRICKCTGKNAKGGKLEDEEESRRCVI
jgi:hypothetical protein